MSDRGCRRVTIDAEMQWNYFNSGPFALMHSLLRLRLKGRTDGIVESGERASMSLTKRGGPVARPRGRVARAGKGDISVR